MQSKSFKPITTLTLTALLGQIRGRPCMLHNWCGGRQKRDFDFKLLSYRAGDKNCCRAGLPFHPVLSLDGPDDGGGLPDDYTNPVLALELVKSGEHIKQIIEARPVNSKDGSVRDFLRRSTYKDFGFIFVYAFFFVALGLLLSRTNLSWAKWAGYLAALCAALGAIMDLIEDRGMLKAIAGEASDSLANSIRYPSLAKWGLLFLFSLIVGLLLSARRDLFLFPAVFFLVAALLGLGGVLLILLWPSFY